MKMMKYILAIAIVGMLSSCATVTHNKTYSTNSTELQIQMQDLQCLGETTVSVSYRTYLGLIHKVDKVNGEYADPTNKSYTTLNGVNTLGSHLNRAYDAVLKKFPEARYFQVVSYSKKSERLFLGTESECTATIRAYKFSEHKCLTVNCNCNHDKK